MALFAALATCLALFMAAFLISFPFMVVHLARSQSAIKGRGEAEEGQSGSVAISAGLSLLATGARVGRVESAAIACQENSRTGLWSRSGNNQVENGGP